ncbi:hypothetical protein COLO4_13178 [Corchorus olitorius]|uniref:Uncharacterized protein n=1 Tax=Corchorus olitorius TaxID=93759 RepID=A0A1R3JXV9_9ROSI|nr:hypothetical protein COLO4_13178 [Corchorus olitorius]
MQSGRSQSVVSPIPQRVQSFQAADTRGKHRIQAELKRLEQEARFLELVMGAKARQIDLELNPSGFCYPKK